MSLPPMVAPSMPSVGFSPAGLPPAWRISARLAPDAVGSKNEPNAPSQSDRMPILIVPPDSPPPPVSSVVVVVPPPSSSSSEPQPATSPSASVAHPSATSLRALKRLHSSRCSLDSSCGGGALRCPRSSRARVRSTSPVPSEVIAALLPESDDAAGGDEDDHQEDDADQRVEALRAEDVADRRRVIARVVVDHGVQQRAHPGALEPVQPADDGDDQDVDRLREVDRSGRDAAVVEDGEEPADGREERGEREGEGPVA